MKYAYSCKVKNFGIKCQKINLSLFFAYFQEPLRKLQWINKGEFAFRTHVKRRCDMVENRRIRNDLHKLWRIYKNMHGWLIGSHLL